MIETKEDRTRKIPIWITIPVVLLCLLGGGWLCAWWYQLQGGRGGNIAIDPKLVENTGGGRMRGFGGGGFGGPPRFDFGSRSVPRSRESRIQPSSSSNHSWFIRGTTAFGRTHLDGKGQIELSSLGYSPSLATPDQLPVFVCAQAVIWDRTVREKLKVTDEQVAALRKLGPREDMTGVTSEEREQLASLFKAWQAAADAAKTEAEKKLVSALDEIAKKHLDQTKASYGSRYDKIKSVLTDEQIKIYKESAPPPKPGGFSAPSTRPAGPSRFGPASTRPSGPSSPSTRPSQDGSPAPKLESSTTTSKAESPAPATKPAAVAPTTKPAAVAPTTGPATNPVK